MDEPESLGHVQAEMSSRPSSGGGALDRRLAGFSLHVPACGSQEMGLRTHDLEAAGDCSCQGYSGLDSFSLLACDFMLFTSPFKWKCRKCGHEFEARYDNGMHLPCDRCYPRTA